MEIPKDLITKDIRDANEKLTTFASNGFDSLHVLLDFDRTVTIGRNGQDDATTWDILQQNLPPEGQKRYADYFKHYRQLEIDGTMTQADAEAWWTGILNLYVEYAVNLREIENDYLNKVTLRPGAKELFAVCNDQSIPIVILSAGIKNVIEILLRRNSLTADLTLSTELQANDAGIVSGWKERSLVHVLNKHEIGHSELTRIKTARPDCLLVGDSINDAAMALGTEGVFRVRISDPRVGETKSKEEIRVATFNRFDAIIETGSFTDC